jgi:hypothetical protein
MMILDVKKTENTPTTGRFGRLRGNSGLSEVDNHRLGSGAEATMRPQVTANAGISGGDDRFESEAQAGTGIFTNAFADQWTSQQNDPGSEDKWVRSEIIQHINDLCGFSADSLMVHYMDQQQ